MINWVRAQIFLITSGQEGTIREEQLKRAELELRLERHKIGDRLKGLRGRMKDNKDPTIKKMWEELKEEDVSNHLDLREIDDFRIIYRDKIK